MNGSDVRKLLIFIPKVVLPMLLLVDKKLLF